MTAPGSAPKKLLVIDGHNILYRAYYAMPALHSLEGVPTNALYGFARMVLALMDEIAPDYVAVAVDLPSEEPTYRELLMPDYKATRPPMPPDLVAQLPLLPQLALALGVPLVGVPGYEADDVMGTLAARAAAAGAVTYLATGDQDAYQLVNDRTFVCAADRSFRGNVILDPKAVRERLGVDPTQVVDYKALAGDPTDNIKGVSGVGPKRAAELLAEFGTLERAIEQADRIGSARVREALLADAEQCRRARQVIEIRTDLDLPVSLEDLERHPPDPDRAREVLTRLNFRSVLERLVPATATTAELAVVEPGDTTGTQVAVARLRAAGTVGILLRSESGRIAEIAAAAGSSFGVAFPIGFGGEHDLFATAPAVALPDELAGLLGDCRLRKVCYDAKDLLRSLEPAGVTVGGIEDDVLLAAYLLAHGEGGLGLPRIAARTLGADIRVPEGPRDTAALATVLIPLRDRLVQELNEASLTTLYREVELPLAFLLARMESAGVLVDRERLREVGAALRERIAQAEEHVYELAGERFAIGSPKQLQVVLFERLKLPHGRKTKTGYSTDADTLEELAAQHPVVDAILEWRQLTKLLSTYVEALLALADPATGRVHTRFNQAAVVTGRLSSSDPNLQNIPVRSEWGREVRRCFTAPPGDWTLLSCDYSQIELRILAHFSKDEHLLTAFREGIDVHAHTASVLFDTPVEDVTPSQRARAKTVNFGVIYGMGPQRLSRELRIPQADAKRFIDLYFERYRGVREHVEEAKRIAHETGFVCTMMGRRRNLPDIRSSHHGNRAAAERTAVNTPIQGTAADLMKVAMLRIDEALGADSDVRMLLQVHDELLFEVPLERVREVARKACELMASPLQLDVPIVVDAKAGPNWGDMEPLS